MTEEKTEETAPETKDEEKAPRIPSPKSVLADFEGAPDKETLDKWKAAYGSIFVTAFDKNEIFICRCLDRKTWTTLNRQVAENQAKIGQKQQELLEKNMPEAQVIKATENMELDQEQLTVNAALLWTSLTPQEVQNRAGIITALSDNIMTRSRFMPIQITASLTEEL